MLCFTDSDFQTACKELEEPQIDGYEFFTQSHDVTIYRLYNEESGLYQYKVYGTLSDVLPDICAQVYMDLDYRKQWDSYVKDLYETTADGNKVIYWNVAYPFPMSNRDYVYARELREIDIDGKKIWTVLAKSVDCPSIPENRGVIRVDDYLQSCALTSDGKQGSKDWSSIIPYADAGCMSGNNNNNNKNVRHKLTIISHIYLKFITFFNDIFKPGDYFLYNDRNIRMLKSTND
ncbi:hypothetical protein KUTeg_015292 [Tegillarca granosa]|uniref:START domain-containing protein n=1 Tax=Tegillarca granosa TaxID=220873 RepID=A0ABQ9EPP9_TEGGR|nr:hypothetical protein KUTeg_015292 [Tegillarca granosa]